MYNLIIGKFRSILFSAMFSFLLFFVFISPNYNIDHQSISSNLDNTERLSNVSQKFSYSFAPIFAQVTEVKDSGYSLTTLIIIIAVLLLIVYFYVKLKFIDPIKEMTEVTKKNCRWEFGCTDI